MAHLRELEISICKLLTTLHTRLKLLAQTNSVSVSRLIEAKLTSIDIGIDTEGLTNQFQTTKSLNLNTMEKNKLNLTLNSGNGVPQRIELDSVVGPAGIEPATLSV